MFMKQGDFGPADDLNDSFDNLGSRGNPRTSSSRGYPEDESLGWGGNGGYARPQSASKGFGPPRPPPQWGGSQGLAPPSYGGDVLAGQDDHQNYSSAVISADARARIEQQRQRAAQQRRERAIAANMVGRNEAPAVGFGAPSQFGRPSSAAGFGVRPGTATGFSNGGLGPQTVHTPNIWDRPSTASAIGAASAFGRSAAIGPTRRELLQEVARENGETMYVDSAFQSSNSFSRGARSPDSSGNFGGWPEVQQSRGRESSSEPAEQEGKSKFGDSTYEPGIRSPPSSPPPPPTRAGKALYTTQNLDTSDIRAFLMEPGPKNGAILCHIRREKGKLGYPYYAVYLEAPGVMPGSPEGERFLLSARKRKKSKTSNYLISIDLDDTSRQSGNYFGKLRSNFVGTEFTVYDGGMKPSEASGAPEGPESRCELGAVMYQYNVLGTRGPRKMTAIVPKVNEKGERLAVRPKNDKDKDQILRRHKERGEPSDELVTMINKPPKWNDQMQAYCLNFNGRVTKASVKNFQLASGDALDHVILQFGKVGKDAFTMDYAWPINALQAFAICLTSFDNKLACE